MMYAWLKIFYYKCKERISCVRLKRPRVLRKEIEYVC